MERSSLAELKKAYEDSLEREPIELAVSAYIAALEAARVAFEHKASQYDSVVAAVKVADGGRFRNDTIDSLLSRLRKLEARVAELEAWIAPLDGMSRQIIAQYPELEGKPLDSLVLKLLRKARGITMERPDLDATIRHRVNGTLNDVHLREIGDYIEQLEDWKQTTNATMTKINEIVMGSDYKVELWGKNYPDAVEWLLDQLEALKAELAKREG